MFSLFQFFARLLPSVPDQDAREHAFLARAVSLYDLECRERDIARGRFARQTHWMF